MITYVRYSNYPILFIICGAYFALPAFRQRLFCQNSLNKDSPRFNNTKVSGFTVHCEDGKGPIIVSVHCAVAFSLQ